MHLDRNGGATSGGMRPVALVLAGLFGLAAVGAGVVWVGSGQSGGSLAGPEALAAESVRALEARDATAAERALTRELAWGEHRPSTWCRLAYARFMKAGRMDDKVNAAVRRSYQVAPLDADTFAWRVRFVFDNWGAAAPDVRRAAMAEARAFHAQWPTRPAIEASMQQVRDPLGRFALRFAVRGAEPKAR